MSLVLRQLENKRLVNLQVPTTKRVMSNGILVPSLGKALETARWPLASQSKDAVSQGRAVSIPRQLAA